MKKSYSTPDIFFDSMALNENIASANQNCSRNVTNMYSNICGLQFGSKIVFTLAAMCIMKRGVSGLRMKIQPLWSTLV